MNLPLPPMPAALDQIAALAGQRVGEGRGALQAVLDGAPAFRHLFKGGGFITNAEGVAIAAWPTGSGREGVNYSDRSYIREALAAGRTVVGPPVIGRTLGFAQQFQKLTVFEAALDHLEIPADHRQQVVEIMRDPAGELTDGLHLLGLYECRLHALLFTNIERQYKAAYNMTILVYFRH